ncbi:4149_t:CDS:1 [Dentiscutata erythropus]|uniref:4149_t:CDS:1 n=1 Tax=Dentiscutata erythropus TaxID=1348616 RepID=A0A9N9FEB4_9GLOM|nr:4149_t:CDS:1 [Dentiscutata erythropus]
MDSFKEKALILNDIRSNLMKLSSKFQNDSDSISTDFRTSFRQQLFVDHDYDPSICDDEISFLKLFECQLDYEIPTETIHQDEISKIEAFLGEDVKTEYLNAINSAHKFCLQNCRDQKRAALRDIFMLPSGNKDYVIKTLSRIDSSFADMLSHMVEQFRVNIGFYNANSTSINNSTLINQTRFTDEIKQILENYFCEVSDRPKHCEKLELSKSTGLTIKQIETWFNNRRNRAEKDNEKLERLTTEFLDKNVDWDEKFTAVRSGKMTAKDMRTSLIEAFDLPYIDSIEEDSFAIAEEIETARSNESPSVKKSTKTRGRLTKEARKKVAPYNKSTPMTTKIAMMRTNNAKNDSIPQDEDSQNPTSVVQHSAQLYENEFSPESNISQQTTTDIFNNSVATTDIFDNSIATTDIFDNSVAATDIFDNSVAATDIFDNSVATTNTTTLKIRHRPNKNLTRAISQPYNRTRQNKQIIKDNEPIISRVPSMDEDQFQVAEEIQPQNLDFTQVNDMIQYASLSRSSTSSFEGDFFDYVSTYAPTTSFSNLSDISDFSQLSDAVELDQLSDLSTVNSYSTLPFDFEQYGSSSTIEQSLNDHDFTFNAATMSNLSDSYLDCTSNTNTFVSTNTSQNFSSEQASIIDVTNQYNLFDLLPDNDMNITQQTYFGNSSFTIDSLGENIDPNDVES